MCQNRFWRNLLSENILTKSFVKFTEFGISLQNFKSKHMTIDVSKILCQNLLNQNTLAQSCVKTRAALYFDKIFKEIHQIGIFLQNISKYMKMTHFIKFCAKTHWSCHNLWQCCVKARAICCFWEKIFIRVHETGAHRQIFRSKHTRLEYFDEIVSNMESAQSAKCCVKLVNFEYSCEISY